MAHIVINKKIFFLAILFFATIEIFAQQQSQTEPNFIYKDLKNKNLSKLNYFLGTFPSVPLDDCLFASGTFKFKIVKDGKISNFQVTGNLPDTLVNTIKKRIFQTEGYWVFSKEPEGSKWFVLPVFIGRKISEDCKVNKSIEETYSLLFKLFDEKKVIDTPTSYLLYPIYLFGLK